MYSLADLPYEVLSFIINYLSIDDVDCLGQTSKSLRFLLEEERICKQILQTKLRYSNEALSAITKGGNNARNLRRALKRREAFATASPYIVCTIGYCDTYLYLKGVLCYTIGDKIRVLNLHHSGRSELVISIPTLLANAYPLKREDSKGEFRLLYYSDFILSCLYKSCGPQSTAWLISFNLQKKRILVVHELASTDKIFVRHNKQYLYYGTHSELGTDGYKKWVIQGYEFGKRKWFEKKIHLLDMVGSEIGATICFEIYDDYFYGLSNTTTFEVEEIDWTSFYHGIRFPLGSPCVEMLEKTENLWRRQHLEGPIDDRWTSLRLVKDERSGNLQITEARREWYLGSSRSQRTYYTTDFSFPPLSEDEDKDIADSPSDPASLVGLEFLAMPPWLAIPPPTEDVTLGTASNSSTSATSLSIPSTIATASSMDTDTSDPPGESVYPDQQLAKLIDRKDNHPNYISAPGRSHKTTHPGYDGPAEPTFTTTKVRIRTFDSSSDTYVDLGDDPSELFGAQRLRLRAGSRKRGPILKDASGLIRKPAADLSTSLHEIYRVSPITYFPPRQHVEAGMDELHELMNPPTCLGNVHGNADERSMVYVTGSLNKPQALVFIGFDPSIRLVGLKRWGTQWGMKGVGEGPHVDGRASGKGVGFQAGTNFVDVVDVERTLSLDRKGKEEERTHLVPLVHVGAGCAPMGAPSASQFQHRGSPTTTTTNVRRVGAGKGGWAWKEEAMYRSINKGYYFGLDRKEKVTT